MIDWGLGHYERTAVELEPVSARAVEVANPRPGERVLDLATGTGNAALIAARAGASVTGLDVSARLVDVARQRASEAGVDAAFVVGDVDALPFEDGSFDIALSVFGIIFAPARFPWHDREAVTELAARHGASVQFDDGELEITADSPEAYLHANAQHPMSVAARPVLERAGTAPEVRADALAALEAGNEDPDGFRIHSPYRLIEIRAQS